jgi:hypothetical protein
MPYFYSVGNFSKNKNGMGTRGWRIWRRRNRLFWEFGAVDVVQKRVYWVGRPNNRNSPCKLRTVARAKEKMERLIAAKLRGRNGDPGYTQLKPGQRILKSVRVR